MPAGDVLNYSDQNCATLLCAKCKQTVISGTPHTCEVIDTSKSAGLSPSLPATTINIDDINELNTILTHLINMATKEKEEKERIAQSTL